MPAKIMIMYSYMHAFHNYIMWRLLTAELVLKSVRSVRPPPIIGPINSLKNKVKIKFNS